eukprot:scaffold8977_cov128-Isochrysis_galbana.AAC.3
MLWVARAARSREWLSFRPVRVVRWSMSRRINPPSDDSISSSTKKSQKLRRPKKIHSDLSIGIGSSPDPDSPEPLPRS